MTVLDLLSNQEAIVIDIGGEDGLVYVGQVNQQVQIWVKMKNGLVGLVFPGLNHNCNEIIISSFEDNCVDCIKGWSIDFMHSPIP